jgi:tetratricopeptide (TPR) repeat protein
MNPIQTLLRNARSIGYSDIPAALDIACEASALAAESMDPDLIADTLNTLGDLQQRSGRLDDAFASFGEALETARKNRLTVHEADALQGLGFCHFRAEQFVKAQQCFVDAIDVAAAGGHSESEARSLVMLARAYAALGELSRAVASVERAIGLQVHHENANVGLLLNATRAELLAQGGLPYRDAFLEALEYAEALNRLTVMPLILVNIAGSCYHDHEYEKAGQYYQRVLDLIEQLGGSRRLCVTAYAGLGGICSAEGDCEAALNWLGRALDVAREVESSQADLFSIHSRIGVVYSQMQSNSEALAHFSMALRIAETSDSKRLEVEAHRMLADFHKQAGEFEQSCHHRERYIELLLEVRSEESLIRIRQLETWHELELARRETEVERLRAEQLRQQLERQRAELAAQAIHTVRQTELLGTFRNELRRILRQTDSPLVAVTAIREKLREMPCEAIDWTKFNADFQQNYPDFREKLLAAYPDLTKMEVKICSMLKLRLTSNDIATLFCLSERSVESHRYNIRKKLGAGRGESVQDLLDRL